MKQNLTNDEPVFPDNEKTPGKINLSLDIPQTEYIQCFVCGHKNPVNTGICEMCSNYLFIKSNSRKEGK